MNARILKLLILWNVVLSVVLVASLAFNAMWAQASNEPPVHVFGSDLNTQGADYNWASAANGLPINDTAPVTLVEVRVNLDTTHWHTCLVTGSATAVRTSGGGIWNYGLGMDSPATFKEGSSHAVEFEDFAAGGVGRWEVSTIAGWSRLRGTHTFYLLANKNTVNDPESRAFNASLHVACFQTKI